ncbi:hypothetical protein [Oricola indica]|jgi:hypothetical protein|nr:hypothetical protein [Oricola indica]
MSELITIGYGDDAGFAVIEAEKIPGVPCAVAHGVVEVWPLVQGDE